MLTCEQFCLYWFQQDAAFDSNRLDDRVIFVAVLDTVDGLLVTVIGSNFTCFPYTHKQKESKLLIYKVFIYWLAVIHSIATHQFCQKCLTNINLKIVF